MTCAVALPPTAQTVETILPLSQPSPAHSDNDEPMGCEVVAEAVACETYLGEERETQPAPGLEALPAAGLPVEFGDDLCCKLGLGQPNRAACVMRPILRKLWGQPRPFPRCPTADC